MRMLASKTKWSNPCGKWIRERIRTIPEEKMQMYMSNAIDVTIAQIKELGYLKKPNIVAIDKHSIERYGKNRGPYVINGKAKNGTTHFEVYGTAQCVNNECRAQIAAMPIKKGDSMEKIVRKLLGDCIRNSIKTGLVLVDREFFQLV